MVAILAFACHPPAAQAQAGAMPSSSGGARVTVALLALLLAGGTLPHAAAQVVAWQNVGSRGFTIRTPNGLAFSPNGTLFVGYNDGTPKAQLARWDGAAWATSVGGAISPNAIANANIAINASDGMVHAVYTDSSSKSVTVKRLGSSGWEQVGLASSVLGSTGGPWIEAAIDAAGTAYIAYATDDAAIAAVAMRFDGTQVCSRSVAGEGSHCRTVPGVPPACWAHQSMTASRGMLSLCPAIATAVDSTGRHWRIRLGGRPCDPRLGLLPGNPHGAGPRRHAVCGLRSSGHRPPHSKLDWVACMRFATRAHGLATSAAVACPSAFNCAARRSQQLLAALLDPPAPRTGAQMERRRVGHSGHSRRHQRRLAKYRCRRQRRAPGRVYGHFGVQPCQRCALGWQRLAAAGLAGHICRRRRLDRHHGPPRERRSVRRLRGRRPRLVDPRQAIQVWRVERRGGQHPGLCQRRQRLPDHHKRGGQAVRRLHRLECRCAAFLDLEGRVACPAWCTAVTSLHLTSPLCSPAGTVVTVGGWGLLLVCCAL